MLTFLVRYIVVIILHVNTFSVPFLGRYSLSLLVAAIVIPRPRRHKTSNYITGTCQRPSALALSRDKEEIP